MRVIVPPLDVRPWPTLGPEICDWIEDSLVHGPGDILGEPVTLTDEFRLYIYRAYEIYPRGHMLAGRRRFKRCVLCRRKGVGKTELGAWIALAELDDEAPVRCDGWRREDGVWVPVGRPVRDPMVLMFAYTEEQADDLAYDAAKKILESCTLGEKYDVGEERIMFADRRGRIIPGELKALASAPSAREGARTTHQHVDEPHLWTTPRHHRTYTTILDNVPKRLEADAWTHETSTMYGVAEGSILEFTHLAAEAIGRGEIEADQAQLLFDHRQASVEWNLGKRDELLEAIKEASGDAWEFADPHAIAGRLQNLDTDGPNFRRKWLNQPWSTATRMFSPGAWEKRKAARKPFVEPGTEIVLMFDGSYARDSTGIVGATVEEKPYLFVVEAWERPLTQPHWRTPRLEVDAAIDEAMSTWRVLELACDPPGWHHELEEWADIYGDVVTRFETAKPSMMGPASDAFDQALSDGGFSHDGDERLARHVANCVPAKRRGYVVPTKEYDDSPKKIDLAIGAIGAFQRARWHHVNGGFAEPWVIRR